MYVMYARHWQCGMLDTRQMGFERHCISSSDFRKTLRVTMMIYVLRHKYVYARCPFDKKNRLRWYVYRAR